MDNKQFYTENFYRAQKEGSLRSAEEILPIVAKFIHPRSVIDVGCGVGGWLAVWQSLINGIAIYGADGDYVDRSQLFIAEENFYPTNLEERITLRRRFDLAMSLEVAEHLTPARGDSFVEDLVSLSNVILFSAAIPKQGGTNHINEQWQSYWAQKFSQYGYVGIDCIRPKIWTNDRVETWYRQNTLLYVYHSLLYRYPELQEFYLRYREVTIFDMVHPIRWFNKVKG